VTTTIYILYFSSETRPLSNNRCTVIDE